MSALSAGMSRPGEMILLLAVVLLAACSTRAAPVYEHDTTHIAEYEGAEPGCYYNFQRYEEGDRIVTNEPCLNCTCHNRMLMCYLRVCPPFSKAIGQDCTVEKRPDQCCPIITCAEVPVQLLTSTTNSPASIGSTEIGAHDNYGCHVDEKFYADGAQLPIDPRNPCELCYCIRNRTTCVMQECTLRVAGCNPVYLSGVCCPVKYNCDYDEEQSTTVGPTTPGLIMTTTVAPGLSSPQCFHQSRTYNDGELIYSAEACEHCYCFRGDIVCAVQDCAVPLKIHGKHCKPLPAPEGKCCATTYQCDGESSPVEVDEEPTIGGNALIPGQYPEIDQATQSIIPAPGYTDEDDSQQVQVPDAFPGADNVIPEQHGTSESGIEGTIEQETITEDSLAPQTVEPLDKSSLPVETSTELPAGTEEKPTEATGIEQKPEAEDKHTISPVGVEPTKIVLPEHSVVSDEEHPATPAVDEEIPQVTDEQENVVPDTVAVEEGKPDAEIKPVVNVDDGKPNESVLPTEAVISDEEITGIKEVPTKETVLEEAPKPTVVIADTQELGEGSGGDQILEAPEVPSVHQKQPTVSSIEIENPDEPISEDQELTGITATGEPQGTNKPVSETESKPDEEGPLVETKPVTEAQEVAVESSTAFPTEAVIIEGEATKEPAVSITEAVPPKDAKPDDSSTLLPEEVVPEGSSDASTLKPTYQGDVSELPIEAVIGEEEATKEPAVFVTEVVPPNKDILEDTNIYFPGQLPSGGSILGEDSAFHDASTLKPTEHKNIPELPTTGVPITKTPVEEANEVPEKHDEILKEKPLPDTIQSTEASFAEEKPTEVEPAIVHEHPASEIPTPGELPTNAPIGEENVKPATEAGISNDEHPTEPVVTEEEEQPEGPSNAEHPSKPTVHGNEHDTEHEIPSQGPTGIPMSERVPVHKAEDKDAVNDIQVTEVYDDVQHTHVPDSLILDAQEKLPATYIPPAEPTSGSEIKPEQGVTVATEHDLIAPEQQTPLNPTAHNERPLDTDIQTKIPVAESTSSGLPDIAQGQADHEKPIETEQQPIEATEKETKPLEHGADEQHKIDEPIHEEIAKPTESTAPAPQSPEVSTEIHEVKPEAFDESVTDAPAEVKPTESQKPTDSEHQISFEDESFPTKTTPETEESPSESPVGSDIVDKEGENQTQEPIVSVEIPVENVSGEEKPLGIPTHDEKVTEISTVEEHRPTEASVVEEGSSESSISEEEPTATSTIEGQPAEESDTKQGETEISVPVAEPATPSITEENPIVPIIADEKSTEASIPQEHLTEGTILNEVPVEAGVVAEEKPTDGSVIEEKPTDGSVIEEKPSDGSVIEEKPTDGSDIEEKPIDGSVIEEMPTEAPIVQEQVPEVFVHDEKPIRPVGSTEKKPSDVLVTEQQSTESSVNQEELTEGSITDHKPIEDSVTEEKPIETSGPGTVPTQASIDEQKIIEPSNDDQKPLDTSVTEEKPTETSITDLEPTIPSVVEEDPAKTSTGEGFPTQASISEDEIIEHTGADGKPTITSVGEEKPTDASVTKEEITSAPISEEKLTEASVADHEPTVISVVEEKPTDTASVGEIPTQTSITNEETSESSGIDEKPTDASVVDEKPTEISTEEKVTDVPTIEEKPSQGPVTEHEITGGSTVDENPTEVSVTEEKTPDISTDEQKPIDAFLAEGEPTNAPAAEEKPTTGSVLTEEIPQPAIVDPTKTSVAEDEPVEASIPAEKPDESPIPTDIPTKNIVTEEEPTKVPISGDQLTAIPEHEPTIISIIDNQHTETSSTDKAIETSVTDEEPAEPIAVEENVGVTSPAEEKPTEVSLTDQKVTDASITEEKPTEVSITEEASPTDTSAIEEKPVDVGITEEKPTETSLSDQKIADVPDVQTHITDISVAEEKPTDTTVTIITESGVPEEEASGVSDAHKEPTEPLLGEEKPTEGLAIDEKPTESSIAEEHLTENSEISEKPTEPSLSEQKPTGIPTTDDKVVESSAPQEEPSEPSEFDEKPAGLPVTDDKPIEIPAGGDEATESSVPEEEPSKPSINETPIEPSVVEEKPTEGPVIDDKLTESSVFEEKPTEAATAEEKPTQTYLPEEKPTILSEILVNEEKVTVSSVSEEKPTESSIAGELPTKIITEKEESGKPSTHEDEPILENKPSEPSPFDEKPTESTITQEIPTQAAEEVQSPIHPSTEEHQPIEPGKPTSSSEVSNEDDEGESTKKRPELFGDNFPSSIPGEGNCLVDGQSFANNSAIPPANLCQLRCHCVSSIVHCDLVECAPPPTHLSNCMPVHTSSDSCCPIYSCDSAPTAELESDSQIAEHTPGYEGIAKPASTIEDKTPAHIHPVDEHVKQPSTSSDEHPVEPSSEVTPIAELQTDLPVNVDVTASVDSDDKKTVVPIEQEVIKPTASAGGEPASVDTNEIPEQLVPGDQEQNVKPEVVTEAISPIEPQTEKVITPSEVQQIVPVEQKPTSPIEASETPEKVITTDEEPTTISTLAALPVTTGTANEHAAETPVSIDEQSVAPISPVTDINVPLISVDEHNTETIATNDEYPVEPSTADQDEHTDITKPQKPTIEVETETVQPSLPVSENDIPEEPARPSETPLDNETARPYEEAATVIPVTVSQDEEIIADKFEPGEKDATRPVAPSGESSTEQSGNSAQGGSTVIVEDQTERGELPVTDEHQQTPGSIEPTEISTGIQTDESIVKGTDDIIPSIEQHPETHVPETQPESDGQSTVPTEPIEVPAQPIDQSDLQQQLETGEPVVLVDSSTIGNLPEIEAPASTISAEDHSESAVPAGESHLPDHVESSPPSLAGQEESVKPEDSTVTLVHADEEASAPTTSTDDDAALTEGSTSGPATQTDTKPSDSTPSSVIDELLPTKSNAHDDSETLVSGENTQETTAPTNQQTPASAINEDVQIVEAEPTVESGLPDSTKELTPGESVGEQTTLANEDAAVPSLSESPATPVSGEHDIIPVEPATAGPVSHDEAETAAPAVSNEGQVMDVEATAEPVTPEHAESPELTTSVEGEPIGVEGPTIQPALPEVGIESTVPVENAPDHEVPILEPTAGPVGPETIETPAPTVSQEDEIVAAENPTSGPVLIDSTETTVSTVSVEGQTVADVDKVSETPSSDHAESPESTVSATGEPVVAEEPNTEPALSSDGIMVTEPEVSVEDQSTYNLEPSAKPALPESGQPSVPAVSEEGENAPIEHPSTGETPQGNAETLAPTIHVEDQTVIVQEPESVSPDHAVTHASPAGEDETTAVQQPAAQPSADDDSKAPVPTVDDEEQTKPIQESHPSPVIPDLTETSAPVVSEEGESVIDQQHDIVHIPHHKTESPAPTESVETETIPTGQPGVEQVSGNEAETAVPTVSGESEIISVEGPQTSRPVSDDQIKLATTSATPEDHGDVTPSTSIPSEGAEASAPTTNTNDNASPVDDSTAGPVALEEHTELTVSTVDTNQQTIEVEPPTSRPISTTGAETPLSTPSEEGQIVVVETEAPAPTAGTPDQTITDEVPTAGTISTDHAKEPLPTLSEDGEHIGIEQQTAGPVSHDDGTEVPTQTVGSPDEPITAEVPTAGPVSTYHAEPSLPTSSGEGEITTVEQATAGPVLHDDNEAPAPTAGTPDQSITVEVPTAGPVLTDHAKEPLPTLSEDGEHIGVEQPTVGPVSHDDSETSAPLAGTPDESITVGVPTAGPVSTDAEEPLPTPNTEGEVIAVEEPIIRPVSHDDDTEAPAPTAGILDQSITAEVPTVGPVSTDAEEPLPTPSTEGEIVAVDQPTAEPVAHDDTEAPTENTSDEIATVKEPTVSPTIVEHAETPMPTVIAGVEAVEAEEHTDESDHSESSVTSGPNVGPLDDTLTITDLNTESPKQNTTTNLLPEEPTVHQEVEGIPTAETITEEALTQSSVDESVKPDSEIPATDEPKQEVPIEVTSIEQKPEVEPVVSEEEHPAHVSESDIAPTTDASEETASKKPSVSEESPVESTPPAAVEGEVTESGIKNVPAEEKPVAAVPSVTVGEKPVVSDQTELPINENIAGNQATDISAPAQPAPSVAPEEQTDKDEQQHIQTPDQFGEVPEHPAIDDTEGQLTIGLDDHPVLPIEHPTNDTKHPTKPGYFGHPITSTLAPQGSLAYPDQMVSGEDNSHFPVNNGSPLTPEGEDGDGNDDYDEDDPAIYGPGTCRYSGKVYVSAQQIPRDDPCDFCFCFRSDIICLQQSCPPPIPGCHEEPINGFCCPRYECPVSMATSLNVTTTTTTTTTTLPPHFLTHAYKGAARRSGCQIRGQAYRVGEVIPSSSGPCLQCTCGGDGNMKCEPRVCSPEPMLRQMIAAATAKRRR